MIKRLCKMALVLSMSLGVMANYYIPAYAEEEEEVTLDVLKERIESVQIMDRDNIDQEVSVDVIFNNDEGFSDVKLNVKDETESFTIENPDIKDHTVYIFNQEFEEGNYTVSSLELKYNDEEYQIDLSSFDFINNFMVYPNSKSDVDQIEVQNSVSIASTPNLDDETCYGSGNPVISVSTYSCFQYAWGRVKEVLGIELPINTDEWKYCSNAFDYSSTPNKYGIIVYFNEDDIVHVAFVEDFDGDAIAYSEGNYNETAYHANTYSNLSDFESETENYWNATSIKYISIDHEPEVCSLELSGCNLEVRDGAYLYPDAKPYSLIEPFTFTWSSSNPEIATVDNEGYVLAISPGSTTITVEAENGLYATCTVRVLDDSFAFNGAFMTIGASFYLQPAFTMPKAVKSNPSNYNLVTEVNGLKTYTNVSTATIISNEYYFSLNTSIKNIEDTMYFSIEDLNGNRISDDPYTNSKSQYSVNTYLNNLIQQGTDAQVKIAKALQQYSYYTRTYFEMSTKNTAWTNNLTLQTIPSTYKGTSCSTFIGARLKLKLNSSLKLYFKEDNGITVNGYSTGFDKYTEGKYTVIEIPVKVLSYSKVYAIKNGSESMTYSLLSYGYDTNKTSIQNLMKSMYTLHIACQEYAELS